jgi:hypothetical protein
MEDLLKNKVLYQMNLGLDPRPLDAKKHRKILNCNDEARYLIGMTIFEDLKFHIQSINTT